MKQFWVRLAWGVVCELRTPDLEIKCVHGNLPMTHAMATKSRRGTDNVSFAFWSIRVLTCLYLILLQLMK